MSHAQTSPEGGVTLVTPTGIVTLSRAAGHRVLFHGAPVDVDGAAVVSRHGRSVFLSVGGACYLIGAHNLSRLFQGRGVRCRIYPCDPDTARGVRKNV